MRHRGETQVIGFGPAAVGIGVAADRVGLIDALIERGIVFVERARNREGLGPRRFPWRLLSNSPGRDFVAGIRADGIFGEIRRSASEFGLSDSAEAPAWLPHVGRLVNALSDRLEVACTASSNSTVLFGCEVASVTWEDDGSFTSRDARGTPLVHSQSVIFASGAEERTDGMLPFARAGATVLSSGAVLANGMARVSAGLRQGNRLHIIGSSHSAFGVAYAILHDSGTEVSPGQIRIWCRRNVALYSPRGELPVVADTDVVCPETGDINRFNGLRGTAKDLAVAIQNGAESRITLDHGRLRPDQVRPGDVVLSATGYMPRLIRLVYSDGDAVHLAPHGVDERCRVTHEGGAVIPNAYGLGIGYPRLDACHRGQIGLNRFHGPDAQLILEQLGLEEATSVRAAASQKTTSKRTLE